MIAQLNHTEDTLIISIAAIIAGYIIYLGLKKVSKSINKLNKCKTYYDFVDTKKRDKHE